MLLWKKDELPFYSSIHSLLRFRLFRRHQTSRRMMGHRWKCSRSTNANYIFFYHLSVHIARKTRDPNCRKSELLIIFLPFLEWSSSSSVFHQHRSLVGNRQNRDRSLHRPPYNYYVYLRLQYCCFRPTRDDSLYIINRLTYVFTGYFFTSSGRYYKIRILQVLSKEKWTSLMTRTGNRSRPAERSLIKINNNNNKVKMIE